MIPHWKSSCFSNWVGDVILYRSFTTVAHESPGFFYASPPTGGAAAEFEARQYRALDQFIIPSSSSVGAAENLQGNSTGYKPHDLKSIRQDNQNDLFFSHILQV